MNFVESLTSAMKEKSKFSIILRTKIYNLNCKLLLEFGMRAILIQEYHTEQEKYYQSNKVSNRALLLDSKF